jgi:hypothetical protein
VTAQQRFLPNFSKSSDNIKLHSANETNEKALSKQAEYAARNISFPSAFCSKEKERNVVKECRRTESRYCSLTKRLKSRFKEIFEHYVNE